MEMTDELNELIKNYKHNDKEAVKRICEITEMDKDEVIKSLSNSLEIMFL